MKGRGFSMAVEGAKNGYDYPKAALYIDGPNLYGLITNSNYGNIDFLRLRAFLAKKYQVSVARSWYFLQANDNFLTEKFKISLENFSYKVVQEAEQGVDVDGSLIEAINDTPSNIKVIFVFSGDSDFYETLEHWKSLGDNREYYIISHESVLASCYDRERFLDIVEHKKEISLNGPRSSSSAGGSIGLFELSSVLDQIVVVVPNAKTTLVVDLSQLEVLGDSITVQFRNSET